MYNLGVDFHIQVDIVFSYKLLLYLEERLLPKSALSIQHHTVFYMLPTLA